MPRCIHILMSLLTTLPLSCGCGYMLGSPQVEGVQTVHVPIFKSESYRRNIDYLLTEAVQNEIKTRTRYRLDGPETADTILVGRIVDYRKDPLSETRYDDPRELQLMIGAEIKWIDRRTGTILQQHVFPVSTDLIQQASQISFAPEVGHSLATAQQESVQSLASQIVDLMEAPW